MDGGDGHLTGYFREVSALIQGANATSLWYAIITIAVIQLSTLPRGERRVRPVGTIGWRSDPLRKKLEKNIKATAEESVIGREKLAEERIGQVGMNIARIEMIGEIESLQRQPYTIFPGDLERFRKF